MKYFLGFWLIVLTSCSTSTYYPIKGRGVQPDIILPNCINTKTNVPEYESYCVSLNFPITAVDTIFKIQKDPQIVDFEDGSESLEIPYDSLELPKSRFSFNLSKRNYEQIVRFPSLYTVSGVDVRLYDLGLGISKLYGLIYSSKFFSIGSDLNLIGSYDLNYSDSGKSYEKYNGYFSTVETIENDESKGMLSAGIGYRSWIELPLGTWFFTTLSYSQSVFAIGGLGQNYRQDYFSGGMGVKFEKSKFNLSVYRISNEYFSIGTPVYWGASSTYVGDI